MECKEIVDLLSEYVDGELDEGERRIVDEHLQGCSGCRTQLDTIKSTVSMIQGFGEFEVPAELTHALRRIAQDAPGDTITKMPAQPQTAVKPAAPKVARPATRRRGFALPKLRYLIATTAVAAIALIALLTQIDLGGLEKGAPLSDTASKSAVPSGGRQQTANQELKNGTAHDIDSVDGKQLNATSESKAPEFGKSEHGSKSDDLLMRGLSGTPDTTWPKVVVSKTTYNDDSAHKLLDDIQKKTDGLYTVKDAKTKRTAVINTLLERITANGANGDMMRGPINSLLDETKRSALPVYLERARFDKQECLLIIIRWGFGGDKNSLYRASLYVTDLSGRSVIYYESK